MEVIFILVAPNKQIQLFPAKILSSSFKHIEKHLYFECG